MSNNRVQYGGVTLDQMTVTALQKAEGIAQFTFPLSQGSFSNAVSASAGTHSGGGALDVNITGMSPNKIVAVVKALRAAGFAAWHRTVAEGFDAAHVHAILIADPLTSPAATAQKANFAAGQSGLAGNGADTDTIDVSAGGGGGITQAGFSLGDIGGDLTKSLVSGLASPFHGSHQNDDVGVRNNGRGGTDGHSSGTASLSQQGKLMTTYTVKSGDTMSGIANAHGVTLTALANANPKVTNLNVIAVGEVLVIPTTAPVTTPKPTVPVPAHLGIALAQVLYKKSANGSCTTVVKEAMKILGLGTPWARGLMTIALRESSYNWNSVNTYDLNAHGPIQSDGHPLYCSRGAWQTIPPTFAAYHQPGTSNDIYDGLANVCAAANYIMHRYGVTRDGSNLTSRVQQADPNRAPRGY